MYARITLTAKSNDEWLAHSALVTVKTSLIRWYINGMNYRAGAQEDGGEDAVKKNAPGMAPAGRARRRENAVKIAGREFADN